MSLGTVLSTIPEHAPASNFQDHASFSVHGQWADKYWVANQPRSISSDLVHPKQCWKLHKLNPCRRFTVESRLTSATAKQKITLWQRADVPIPKASRWLENDTRKGATVSGEHIGSLGPKRYKDRSGRNTEIIGSYLLWIKQVTLIPEKMAPRGKYCTTQDNSKFVNPNVQLVLKLEARLLPLPFHVLRVRRVQDRGLGCLVLSDRNQQKSRNDQLIGPGYSVNDLQRMTDLTRSDFSSRPKSISTSISTAKADSMIRSSPQSILASPQPSTPISTSPTNVLQMTPWPLTSAASTPSELQTSPQPARLTPPLALSLFPTSTPIPRSNASIVSSQSSTSRSKPLNLASDHAYQSTGIPKASSLPQPASQNPSGGWVNNTDIMAPFPIPTMSSSQASWADSASRQLGKPTVTNTTAFVVSSTSIDNSQESKDRSNGLLSNQSYQASKTGSDQQSSRWPVATQSHSLLRSDEKPRPVPAGTSSTNRPVNVDQQPSAEPVDVTSLAFLSSARTSSTSFDSTTIAYLPPIPIPQTSSVASTGLYEPHLTATDISPVSGAEETHEFTTTTLGITAGSVAGGIVALGGIFLLVRWRIKRKTNGKAKGQPLNVPDKTNHLAQQYMELIGTPYPAYAGTNRPGDGGSTASHFYIESRAHREQTRQSAMVEGSWI